MSSSTVIYWRISLAYVVLLRYYPMLQRTGKSCVPLREHDPDLIISVVYGIPMWYYQQLSYVRKHSMPTRKQFPDMFVARRVHAEINKSLAT
jgi:hypothetical protein